MVVSKYYLDHQKHNEKEVDQSEFKVTLNFKYRVEKMS